MARTIYHIATDEKFVNTAYFQFTQATQWTNKFYILSKNTQQPLTHVTLQENMFVLPNTPQEKEQLAATVGENDIVVFHSLISLYYKIIFKLPARTQTVWLCYGYELYNDPEYFTKDEIYAPSTLKHFGNKPSIIPRKKQKIFSQQIASLMAKRKKETRAQRKARAIARIDYIGTSFKEEFDALVNKLPSNKSFFEYWHYPLERIMEGASITTGQKKSILIGNAGVPTLNHMDVFDVFEKIEIPTDRKVVVPLSYGLDNYITHIQEKGRKIWGRSFQPIKDFMPLAEYNKILEDVGVAIFYNYRQQAIGNIVALLYMGAKVYLSNKNPIYHFFKRIDVVIFDFDTDFSEANWLEPLTEKEINTNREKLKRLLSIDSLAVLLDRELRKIS